MSRIRAGRTVQVDLPHRVTTELTADLKELSVSLAAEGSFRSKYQSTEMFSKYRDETVTPAARRQRDAVEKLLRIEQKNIRTKSHLAECYNSDLKWIESDLLVAKVQSFVADVLGPFDLMSVLRGAELTNGASTRVRKGPGAAIEKLTGEVHVTYDAWPFWYLHAQNTALEELPVKIVDSSVLFTVPKSSVIDRVACKEPEGNMLLQRAVGVYIRGRLKKHGIDLRDQRVNQSLAKSALAQGLATIDLSAASDSVTSTLVRLLLPSRWYNVLDDLRTKYVRMPDGTTHTLAMFSTMGNGFTFELESLLFFAIARVVRDHCKAGGRVSVFGDDIIVPSSIFGQMRGALAFFGFSMNTKKSHGRGKFRESCGVHYYAEKDVTPFYVREPIRTLPMLINLLNQMARWDMSLGSLNRPSFSRLWQRYSHFVPAEFRGGQRWDDNSALVDGSRPKLKLAPITKVYPTDDSGRLLYWLFQTRHREEAWFGSGWPVELREEPHLEVTPRREIGFKSSRNRDEWDREVTPDSFICTE